VSVPHVPVHVVTALTAALLHALWQCAVLAVAADATLRLLNRRSAALRHAAGMGFLVAMALVPAWMFLRGLSPHTSRTPSAILGMTAIPPLGSASDVLAHTMSNWAAPLCAVWIVGVVVMLVRQVGGLWWLDRLDRRVVHDLPPKWLERLHALQHTMGISRAIVVRLTDDVLVPFTARLFRPIIWVPRALLTRLSHSQIEALLAHELAHIRRLDWLWNGLQCVIEALLFFHPGVWWLSRRIREERERACDAMAATVCADPVALAEALAALARDRQPRPQLLLAADAHPLLDRITLLLSGAPTPLRSAPLGLLSLLVTGAAIAVPFGSRNTNPHRRTAPTPMVDVSAAAARDGESGARRRERAVRATANEIVHYSRAHETLPIALEREQVLRDADDDLRDPEQALRDAEDALRTPEQALRDAEGALRGPEQALRDAELAFRDPERALREAELALRDREQAARDAEDASLGNEMLARYREQLARTREAVVPYREQRARAREAVAPYREKVARAREAVVPYREKLERVREAVARAVEVPTAARAVEAPTAARDAEVPTAARDAEAPTAARDAEAPTAARAIEAVKSVVPYAAHPVQALKVRTPPRKGQSRAAVKNVPGE
jgi:beta-lactamase regulating signal transducer with metallopeptidase domain